MRCPECNDKLGTLRTTDYGDKTLRERKCSKCNTNHPTIELFEKDYDTKLRQLSDELALTGSLRSSAESRYRDLVTCLDRVNRHVDEFKKKAE